MFLPTRAIRDEGTSFHYMEPGQFIDLNTQFIKKVEAQLDKLDLEYDEITTWTTDGFFRETPKKVAYFRQLGASVVEMECAGMPIAIGTQHAFIFLLIVAIIIWALFFKYVKDKH